MCLEIAVVASVFALGNILFGHFEERTPKWKRVAKFFVFIGITAAISATAGRGWFFAIFGALMILPLAVHLWWLPCHGINGWTAEPKEKYYELRGWKLPERNQTEV
jgi:hypothetical protein